MLDSLFGDTNIHIIILHAITRTFAQSTHSRTYTTEKYTDNPHLLNDDDNNNNNTCGRRDGE